MLADHRTSIVQPERHDAVGPNSVLYGDETVAIAIQSVDAVVRYGICNGYSLALAIGQRNPEQSADIVGDKQMFAARIEHKALWRTERTARREH